MVKTLRSNAGGMGLIPDWGNSDPICFRVKDQHRKTEAIL